MFCAEETEARVRMSPDRHRDGDEIIGSAEEMVGDVREPTTIPF